MTCIKKAGTIHSGLCDIEYPHRRTGSDQVTASKKRDCTIDLSFVKAKDVRATLGYEANMDLVSPDELRDLLSDKAVFGTYCDVKKGHFCVDMGRRTVDGRRLNWLWVFPDGKAKPSNKAFSDPPPLLWTRDQVLNAFRAANNETLSMWTRHVEKFSELAITFCLPLPRR